MHSIIHKSGRRWALALLALLLSLLALPAGAEGDGMLRVQLARLGSPSVIQLRADCDYLLASDPATRIPAGTEMTLSATGGSLTLSTGDRSIELGASARLVRAETGNHGAQFISPSLSNRFCGDLSFSASSGVITTLLHIYVEDYLYGVVGYEMSPSSALEALKAQAIVARNYALRQKASRAASAYDLSDSGDALSFRGYSSASEYADAVKAVDETRGQALYYGDSPATCYYCDSNGGQIESSLNAFGVLLPYSEVRDDPYDFEGAGAKRTVTLSKDGSGLNEALTAVLADGILSQLPAEINPEIVRLSAIEDITPGQARYGEPSRLYTALDFHLRVAASTALGEERTAEFTVSVPTYGGLENWYDLGINADNNETVWLTETDRAFEITFRRSGSGVGMSQRGAQVMARKGLSCWDILEYYYPGTSLKQLTLDSDGQSASQAQAAPAIAPIATARLSQKARLYEKADDSVGALTTLPAGAIVEVYAVQDDWAALGSGGIYGFAHTDALTSFSLIGVTAVQVKEQTQALVDARSVDVLQLPVNGAGVLARLSSGDAVRLNAYSDEWALVTTREGVEGFVPRGTLTLQTLEAPQDDGVTAVSEAVPALLTGDAGLYVNPDESVAPRSALKQGDRVYVTAYNGLWAHVRTADNLTGYVMLKHLSQLQPAPDAADAGALDITRVEGEEFRVVSVSALPLYESYSTDSQVLAVLEQGQRVQLGAYTAQWACVRADGVTGFVLIEGLKAADAPEAGEDEIEGGSVVRVKDELFAEVKARQATLYSSWSVESEVLATLMEGDRLQVGAYNGKWACVRVNGVIGFVELEYLEKIAE